jgi:hypothetical protein
MKLTEGEHRALTDLVESASNQLSNNGCDDFDLSEYLDNDEVNAVVSQYHAWNGDPHEYDPGKNNRLAVPDWALLKFLVHKALSPVGDFPGSKESPP